MTRISNKSIFTAVPLGAAAMIFGGFIAPSTADAEPTAQEIVDKAYCTLYYQGMDARADVHMEIFDAKGRKRVRDLSIIRRDEPDGKNEASRKNNTHCGNQEFYTYFHSPAEVAKMSFMVWKYKGGKSDDRWLYMPALDLVKRIAASDKRTSFFGSHFYYEDVSGRNLDADKHTLEKTTDKYYVIKSVPKKAKAVEFAYFVTYVHKKTFMPITTEYFNSKGKKYRVAEVKKVETIQGNPTVTLLKLSDSRTGGYSTIASKNVKYDTGIAREVFSERYLRKPPKKHIKK